MVTERRQREAEAQLDRVTALAMGWAEYVGISSTVVPMI